MDDVCRVSSVTAQIGGTNMKSSVVAVGSLFLAVALAPVVGAALFVFLLLGQFLLALVRVIGGQSDRTVKQHEPSMNPRGWQE
jgi:hypothetical protein